MQYYKRNAPMLLLKDFFSHIYTKKTLLLFTQAGHVLSKLLVCFSCPAYFPNEENAFFAGEVG